MAGNYNEPQVPIMQNGDFYYPLTTAKQIILPDNRRLGGENGINLNADDVKALSIDISDADAGTIPYTNTDLLGGKPASDYALASEVNQLIASAGSVKTVAGKSPDDAGNVALTASDVGALASGGTAENSNKLNGQAASYYATKSEVDQLNTDKANKSDALTLEEIQASTDLTNKLVSASALRDVYALNNVTYTLGTSGVTVNSHSIRRYGRIVEIRMDINISRTGTITLATNISAKSKNYLNAPLIASSNGLSCGDVALYVDGTLKMYSPSATGEMRVNMMYIADSW